MPTVKNKFTHNQTLTFGHYIHPNTKILKMVDNF